MNLKHKVSKMSDWISQLKAHFPGATTDTSAVAINGIMPACAVAPKDEAEAAQIVRFAAAHRIPIVPCGGGTAQETLNAPQSGFLLLSTRRMNALIHHEPGDMVATVQAGMSVNDFQNAIRSRGQWLPIDAPPDATIGGIVAANTHGPRALGYGTLRDALLGMTIINGDGVIRKCGGKVVKNVTGYALDKLYIGSQGTLGLITEMTFKLRPLSVDGRQWRIECDSVKNALAALRAISAKNLPLEMLCAFNLKSTQAPKPDLDVCAAGTAAELQRIDSELRAAVPAGKFAATSFDAADPSNQGVTLQDFAYKQSLAWGDYQQSILKRARETRNGAGATLRFGCVASKLDAVLEALARHQTSAWSVGLNGGAIELDGLDEAETARISGTLEKLGVNFAFENVTGVNIANRWGKPRAEWTIMKQLKSALDPQGIFNPGRFVV